MRHMLQGMKAPVRKSVAQAPAYLNDAPLRSMAVFAEALAYAFTEPQMTSWTQVSVQIQSGVLRLLRNEAAPGDAMQVLKRALDPLVLESTAALKAFTGDTDCGCAGKYAAGLPPAAASATLPLARANGIVERAT